MTASIEGREQRAQRPSAGASPAGFAVGHLLAGRFRIEAFIGRGAMGEVYEVSDLELGERLAVKVLSPALRDSRALERFKREIQLARRVTHPNVCRIFDLVYHREAADPVGTPFLTMELLRGETLSQRLERTGRLTPAEALPIVRQIVAALTAAHAAGVVHRDLKSSNVILVANGNGPRAVVTDFGLAWSPGADAGPLTGSGQLIGSPAYMAPEQVRGEAVTPASDVYALGVVMYEMVTGERPFRGRSALQIALQRLEQAPASPRALVPGLDRAWEKVILGCLARAPAERPADAAEIPFRLAPRRRRADRRRRYLGAAVAALTAVAAVLAWLLLLRAPPPVSAPTAARTAVAILGFRNLSGDPALDYLGSTLVLRLPFELAATDELRPIPAENVERAALDLGIEPGASLSPETLARLRQHANADVVMTGSYLVERGRHARIDVNLQDARPGRHFHSGGKTSVTSVEGDADELPALLAELGERLRDALGAGELPPAERQRLRAALPSDAEAARLYAEGMARLRTFAAPAARDLLLRAAEREGEHPLIHAALATVWEELGYAERARLAATRAVQLASALRHEDRRLLEARFRQLSHDGDAALAIYDELFSYFPDNLEYGLRLSTAQTVAGRGREALATVAQLRELPPPVGEDPRLELAAARAAGSLSDVQGQLAAAGRAVARGEALGASRIVAQGRLEEAAAYHGLGEVERQIAALYEARRLFERAGDRRGQADVLKQLGVLRSRQGGSEEASELYDQALAVYRELGNKKGEAAVLANLAILRGERRDLDGAAALYEESLALLREVDDLRSVAVVLMNYGSVAVWQGELDKCERIYTEAAALLREVGDQLPYAATLHNLAELRFKRGDLAAAQAQLEAAQAMLDAVGSANYLTSANHRAFGEVALARGDLAAEAHPPHPPLLGTPPPRCTPPAARRHFDAALALDRQGENGALVAETLVELAQLALAEGRAGDAEDAARQALAQEGVGGAPAVQADAERALAAALLATARLSEARAAVDRALARARELGDPWPELQAALVAAQVAAAEGRATARDELEAVRARALRLGFPQPALAARLALAELAPRRHDHRELVSAIRAEAESRGYADLARRAERGLGDGEVAQLP